MTAPRRSGSPVSTECCRARHGRDEISKSETRNSPRFPRCRRKNAVMKAPLARIRSLEVAARASQQGSRIISALLTRVELLSVSLHWRLQWSSPDERSDHHKDLDRRRRAETSAITGDKPIGLIPTRMKPLHPMHSSAENALATRPFRIAGVLDFLPMVRSIHASRKRSIKRRFTAQPA
jgi:hypothetical protein